MSELQLLLNPEEFRLSSSDTSLQAIQELGLRLTTLKQMGDTEYNRQKLYKLVREGVCDTPGFTGEFENYQTFVDKIYPKSYWQHAESQFLAILNEDWVGLCSFVIRSSDHGAFGLTVTTREHRCKGVARALKLQALHYAMEREIKTITTNNHAENKPILRLNMQLGFTQELS